MKLIGNAMNVTAEMKFVTQHYVWLM